MISIKLKSGNHLAKRSILIWRIIQTLVWVVGVLIIFNLIFYPTIGLHLFWNILIPIAPGLLVVGVGVWRNVCPLGSTALFPRHIGFSKRKKLTIQQTSKLNLIAAIALFVIVPLRHAIFNTNGLATAVLLLSLGLISVIFGILFEWKSGWCSSLCPIHPVEKLYGLNNKLTLPNAHCNKCYSCVTPCPDSIPRINPFSLKKSNHYKIAGFAMIGGFPGFVWGWFQVPDYNGITSIEELVAVFLFPIIGLIVTSILFLILNNFSQEKVLISIFSASAVSCYYWYRLPALFGFGNFPGDGMLIDLTGVIPDWSIVFTILSTTIFFFWWIVFRKNNRIRWEIRPSYANKSEKQLKYLIDNK